MLGKTMLGLFTLALAVVFVDAAMAIERGNNRKGKYVYRKVYKACFERGAVASKTPPVSPDTKTQAEWTTLFDNRDFGQFGCPEEWEKLSDKDISDIYTYLHDHASDSPTPAKCK